MTLNSLVVLKSCILDKNYVTVMHVPLSTRVENTYGNRTEWSTIQGIISNTLGRPSFATFLFLPHFDVICDLLLNRRMATWNLFVNQSMEDLVRKKNDRQSLR